MIQEPEYKEKKDLTVRVKDGEPGEYLEVDFGYLGKLTDKETGKTHKLWALVFTANYSRHMYVWLTYRQRVEDVIEGMEHAHQFFGGVFKVLLPDNMKTIVVKTDKANPRLNRVFLEYSQYRGFTIDPARVRSPRDKAKVERSVQYVQKSFFAGEKFDSLQQAQARVEEWLLKEAGLRDHGTTHKQPLRVFEKEEKPVLGPWDGEFYDVPEFMELSVHRDQHVTVKRAYYSVPWEYVGFRVDVRVDSRQVKIYYRGELIATHQRVERGKFSTNLLHYPEDKRAYAGRDFDSLLKEAQEAGKSIGEFVEKLGQHSEIWRVMKLARHVLSLVKKYGAKEVNTACSLLILLDQIQPYRMDNMLKNRTLEDLLQELSLLKKTTQKQPEQEQQKEEKKK